MFFVEEKGNKFQVKKEMRKKTYFLLKIYKTIVAGEQDGLLRGGGRPVLWDWGSVPLHPCQQVRPFTDIVRCQFRKILWPVINKLEQESHPCGGEVLWRESARTIQPWAGFIFLKVLYLYLNVLMNMWGPSSPKQVLFAWGSILTCGGHEVRTRFFC